MEPQMRALAPSSKFSPLITRLVKFLCSVPAGEEITYKQCSDVIEMNVRDGAIGYRILRHARRRAMKEGPAVFETLREVGLRRSEVDEVVAEVAGSGLKTIRRANRRQAAKLEAVRQSAHLLSPAGKLNFVLGAQVTSEVEQTTSSRALKERRQFIVADSPDLRSLLPK